MKFSKVVLFFFPLFPLFFSLNSCGVQEEHIRDYVFYTHTDNEILLRTTEYLVQDFNDCVGIPNFFKTTRDKTEYNSSVIYDANLKQHGKRTVGYGTYLRKASENNPLNVLKGEQPTIYYTYTGEIRLDSDYVGKYISQTTDIDKNTKDYIELKKLFFHEAGHVIGLGHTPNPKDVMYETINGTKDFDAFCETVREYLSQNE